MYSDDDLEEENAPIVNKVSLCLHTPYTLLLLLYKLHLINPTIPYITSLSPYLF